MKVRLSDEERVLLRQAQYAYRGKAGYVSVTVLLMLDHGRAAATIAQDLGLHRTTVYGYAEAYHTQWLPALLAAEAPGYAGRLSPMQLTELGAQIGRVLYTDVRQLVDWVADTFGVQYTRSGLTDLLQREGFCYKKTTAVPCEANAAGQAAFLSATLLPLLERAEAGQAAVYFADAAHPTHNTRASYVWTRKRVERPLLTVSGRERVNLNAALNAVMPTPIHLAETEHVNAESTRRLYEQLLAAHPMGEGYVICDNARYYKNRELTNWLATTRLVQVFLPPYSPNLNLIERFWKFLRQKIINTSFYCTKGAFKTAVLGFFARLDEYEAELTSLLTRRFHLFEVEVTTRPKA